MSGGTFERIETKGFVGQGRADLVAALTGERLAGLRSEVANAREGVLANGRHRVVVLEFEVAGGKKRVAVKAFGGQQGWKDRHDRSRGSKAARSFRAARFLEEHQVATPSPLAYLERWEGARLLESYYLSEYLEGLTSLKTELVRIYRERETCEFLVSLLEKVGAAMRRMHNVGFVHRDLGNQNIELAPRQGGEWGKIYFIDLNRGRIREELTLRERALDFGRLRMPSAFLDILVRIYWGGPVFPGFRPEMARARRRFALWQASRKWRHPIKTLQKKRRLKGRPVARLEDVWIWDDRSAQAAIILDKEDRRKCHSWRNHLRVALANLKVIGGVWSEYRRQTQRAFQRPVKLKGRIGMSLEPADLAFAPQLGHLKKLGKIPVLLRFGHHEGREQWERTLREVAALHAAGHEIMVNLLQDRQAVLDPGSWREFLEFVFAGIDGRVTQVGVGHVVNRMKWGVHQLAEYRRLMEPLLELREKYPDLRLTGPGCIDFELHCTVAALEVLPGDLQFDALSHHLYVDRRGAPENRQGRFGTVEKAALLKAIAIRNKRCGDRVVIPEVNWPLVDTGVWSPVAASYLPPGTKGSKVHVTEQQYGWFMLRYLVLTLCSGFVDQVYWWRLVAHGFGLVDERAGGGWRERIAFRMLVVFLRELGEATFVEKIPCEEGIYAFRFERAEGEVTLLWCHDRRFAGPWPVTFRRSLDAEGKEIELEEVGDSPVYLIV
jgi:hypothetical protein